MSTTSRPTRRNGAAPPTSTSSSNNTATATSSPPPPTRSPLIPTRLEGLLLALYPSTLLLGSVFSLLNPLARSTPYSAASQSHPPELAPSYFARKKNLFNLLFVKVGWFWTTLAFLAFLVLHPSVGPSWRPAPTRRRRQALARYGVVTALWLLVTQWCFGPALIDRGFRWTGGACDLAAEGEKTTMGGGGGGGGGGAKQYVTAAACKFAGGQWRGGHDISGHVFLLVLASAFLWLEILPVMVGYAGLREERLVRMVGGRVGWVKEARVVPVSGRKGEVTVEAKGGVSAPVVVAALSWWMLLMTAAYFHTWFEKFTGLVVAFIGIGTVYLLPRAIPSYRSIVGMPGV